MSAHDWYNKLRPLYEAPIEMPRPRRLRRKFNQNHDPDDGRFTTGDGGGSGGGDRGSEQAPRPRNTSGRRDYTSGVSVTRDMVREEQERIAREYGVDFDDPDHADTPKIAAAIRAEADKNPTDDNLALLDAVAYGYGFVGGLAAVSRRGKSAYR